MYYFEYFNFSVFCISQNRKIDWWLCYSQPVISSFWTIRIGDIACNKCERAHAITKETCDKITFDVPRNVAGNIETVTKVTPDIETKPNERPSHGINPNKIHNISLKPIKGQENCDSDSDSDDSDDSDSDSMVPGVVLIPQRIGTKLSMTKSESILEN